MSASDTIALGRSTPETITRRRMGLLTFVLIVTGTASLLMGDLVWGMPFAGWAWVIWILFTALFALVAFGAAHAFFGFFARRGGGDRCAILRSGAPGELEDVPLATTAIVMPIFNEDVARVFAGLRAVCRSVARTGQIAEFDFFVLSDSSQPERWLEEEAAWAALRRELGPETRVHYRRRRVNSNKKAGNIADFCRRWGRRFRYMIVLDADSVMSGPTLVHLVRLMERNPRAGLIQTAPTIVRADTLFARALQFSFRLYGPVFQAGLNYWQQSEGNYWGHNAIIRLAPFIEHCALPRLPGREPFGGHILSHDFVEAALLRRAGWAVWLAIDLGGSYEEAPPTLIDFAKRDRRWCQGNLQHFWLLFMRSLHGISRVHLLVGVFSYCSALLWLISIALGSLLAIGFTRTGLTWMPAPGIAGSLGVSAATQGAVLTMFTFTLLFLTKMLAVIDLAMQPGGLATFGGSAKIRVGIFIETVLSALATPVLMLFHVKFVVSTLLGRGVRWTSQRRTGAAPSWREAFETHAGHTLVGAVWAAALFRYAPSTLPWLSPLLIGMLLSIPFSRLTGSERIGELARARGWLCTPEELSPPRELRELQAALENAAPSPQPATVNGALVRAVVDPYLNAIHRCLQRERLRQPPLMQAYFTTLRERVLRNGPDALGQRETMALLADTRSMDWLHREVWRRPFATLPPVWRAALKACERAEGRN